MRTMDSEFRVYTRDATMQTGGSTHTRTIRKIGTTEKRSNLPFILHTYVCDEDTRIQISQCLNHNDAFSVFSAENWKILPYFFAALHNRKLDQEAKKDIGGVRMQQRIGHTDDLTHDNKIIIVKSPYHCSHCFFSSPSPHVVWTTISSPEEKKTANSWQICTCWIYLGWNSLSVFSFLCLPGFAFDSLSSCKKPKAQLWTTTRNASFFFLLLCQTNDNNKRCTILHSLNGTYVSLMIGQSEFSVENRQNAITIALEHDEYEFTGWTHEFRTNDWKWKPEFGNAIFLFSIFRQSVATPASSAVPVFSASIPVSVKNVMEQWPQLLISVRFYSFHSFFFLYRWHYIAFSFVMNLNKIDLVKKFDRNAIFAVLGCRILQSSIREITINSPDFVEWMARKEKNYSKLRLKAKQMLIFFPPNILLKRFRCTHSLKRANKQNINSKSLAAGRLPPPKNAIFKNHETRNSNLQPPTVTMKLKSRHSVDDDIALHSYILWGAHPTNRPCTVLAMSTAAQSICVCVPIHSCMQHSRREL